MSQDHEHMGSGVLPICTTTKKICLTWRSAQISDGNRWGGIGGLLKIGMTPEDNAITEMAEEVGFTGKIKMIPAYTFTSVNFTYHNFIGLVSEEFPFRPHPKFAWENDFIAWLKYPQIVELIQDHPNTFHKGIVRLFKESKTLIERYV